MQSNIIVRFVNQANLKSKAIALIKILKEISYKLDKRVILN